MPYITQEKRNAINLYLESLLPHIKNEGELNYTITKICDMYLCGYGNEHYAYYNEVIGVMTCVLLEMYRKKTSQYEDKKCAENGEVYDWSVTKPDVIV